MLPQATADAGRVLLKDARLIELPFRREPRLEKVGTALNPSSYAACGEVRSQNVQGRTKMGPRETPLDTVRWPCGSTWLCQVAESGPKPNPKSQIVVPWFPKCNQRLTKKDHELQKLPKMQPKVPKIEAGGVDLAPK